jgi:4-hydroxy 2-oxovalerate aldolase
MIVKILDCTLRDGGYYNKWDFKPEIVEDYLSVMGRVRVDYVELGLRQIKNERYLGANAYTTAEYLDRLSLPDGPIYGVMVDAKTILSEECSQVEVVNNLFKDRCDEKIGLVRIAAHFDEVSECLPMLKQLKQKGFLVGLNIMQASLRKSEELTEKAKIINEFGCVDVLYFADSLGSMGEEDVQRVYKSIRSGWRGEIGFHAHNNMGRAVSNVHIAIELGCTWVDGTVTGMGRGAGNAEIEYLIENFNPNQTDDLGPLFSLVVKHFSPLKIMCGWGASLPYFVGAKFGLHPTYVQELCSNTHLEKKYLYQVLADLSEIEQPHVFSNSIMEDVISKKTNGGIITGKKVPAIFKDKEILLVAQTDISATYRDAILDYAASKNAILISINLPLKKIDIKYDFVAISHNQRYREDYEKYKDKDYKYIAPAKMFMGSDFPITHDYGMCEKPGSFELCGCYAYVPNRLTVIYAIAFCLEAKAKNISLIGFGGFPGDDPRQKEMEQTFSLLTSMQVNICSLTPTSYSIPEFSIFGI